MFVFEGSTRYQYHEIVLENTENQRHVLIYFGCFRNPANHQKDVGVSENSGTPKSSILIEFSITNHPFWGTPIFGNTHV